MAMFTPKSQLRDMLQHQAAQGMINNHDPLTKMVALKTLIQTQTPPNPASLDSLWMDRNWLKDDDLFS